ncbi:GntR family transcriptional regulator [Kribbella sp. NPDC059898]|uniref:GntR family transcriptional regulator n=1 Tax=Kribbella sp. NPDC059898 TaxID=3346995 RepID=UPI003654836F
MQPIGGIDRSLPQLIYQQLREEIINGRILPGTKLRETLLADSLKVSRIPLREAIPMLEAEGFVTSQPRRGAVVNQLTRRDVDELYAVRGALEPLAAELAAVRVGADGTQLLRELRAAIDRERTAVATGDDADIATESSDVHLSVVLLADNNLLTRMMRQISGRARWLTRLTSPRDSHSALDDHELLFAAIERGDGAEARRISADHIASGRRNSLEMIGDMLPDQA